MIANFYIPRLSNDMKIAVQKNHLLRKIWYRSLVRCKKTASLKKYSATFKIYFAMFNVCEKFFIIDLLKTLKRCGGAAFSIEKKSE